MHGQQPGSLSELAKDCCRHRVASLEHAYVRKILFHRNIATCGFFLSYLLHAFPNVHWDQIGQHKYYIGFKAYLILGKPLGYCKVMVAYLQEPDCRGKDW